MEQKNEQEIVLQIRMQYIKDFSIENPTPFDILSSEENELNTRVDLDVDAKGVAEDTFEVTVSSKLEIHKNDKPLYILELAYAAIVYLPQIEEQMIPLMLFVRAPQMMLPTIRHLIRTHTQESGLPPFNLNDIDFLRLLQEKVESTQSEIQV